jgi:hypothetical protein
MIPRSRHLDVVLVVAAPVMVGLTVNHLTEANAVEVTASATSSVASGEANPGTGATYQNDWRVSLWEVVFDIDDVTEIRSPKGPARVVTRFDGMRYFVGPLPDMMVTASPLWGSFTHTILSAGQARVESKSGSRPRLPVSADDPTARELLVGRNVKLCDDAISVQTEGARRYRLPKPNTFVISNNLIWPTSATTYYSESGKRLTSAAVDSAQPLLSLTEQDVPYDYRELINRGTAKLTPFSGPGGFRQISRTINYTIVRHQTMKLEFLRQCRPDGAQPTQNPPECVPNLIGNRTLVQCTGCTTVDDYYARYGAHFFFIHPNVEVRLKIGNEDVTNFTTRARNRQLKYFEPIRLRRAWDSGLRSDDAGDGHYQLVTDGPNGWVDDPTGAAETGAIAEPNWRDMPAPGEARQPPAWPRKRIVQEFLLGVKGFPEFGFLYYATIVDTRSGWYRVQKSNAERITAEEWCRIKQSPRPRWTGLNPLDDSTWRQAPPLTR